MKSYNKIVTIVGTRPQFVKIDKDIPQTVIHSGQHYDFNMSQKFFKELKLKAPDYNLNIKGNQIGHMIDKISSLLKKLQPELVMVYGDCNTTLAGALAAAYNNIPIAHVEAGVRCGRMDMPEEINRILTDRLATYKFCPTEQAVQNLQWEGIREHVYLVGDVMFDAMNPFCPIKKTKDIGKYILLTIHRQENLAKERLQNIFSGLDGIGKVIFPVHPNTRNAIARFKLTVPQNIKMIDPVGYKKMLTLEANAKHIVTDSGGVTREAFWMQIPVTSLRSETEWPETVNTGWNTLAGDNPNWIRESIENFKKSNAKEQPVWEFGAKKNIRQILSRYL